MFEILTRFSFPECSRRTSGAGLPTETSRLTAGESGGTAGLAASVRRVPTVFVSFFFRSTHILITVGRITGQNTTGHTKESIYWIHDLLSFSFECFWSCSYHSWTKNWREGGSSSPMNTQLAHSVPDSVLRFSQLHLPHVQITPGLINLVVHLRGSFQLLLVHFPYFLCMFQLLFSFSA